MSDKRIILTGRLIDGSGAPVRRNVFLAIEDGVIRAIGSAVRLPQQSGVVIDDFSHCTIVPPLIDCSIFLARSPSLDQHTRRAAAGAGPAQKAAIMEQHILFCQSHGVLGAVECDDIGDLVEQYRRKVRQNTAIDIRLSCRPGVRKPNDKSANPENGDFLRAQYSADIEDEESPFPLPDQGQLSHILQNHPGKKSVVVANGRQRVKEALEAGCDAIEQGYGMGEKNLRRMAEMDVLWIPCVLRAKNKLDGAGTGGDVCCRFSQRYVAPGKPVPGAEALWKKTVSKQLAQLRRARELGVSTAVGTGAGSIGILHGESVAEEMKLFIKAGYSPEKAVRCASAHGATFFGMDNLGPLTTGRKATFLIVKGTVQQLPRKLAFPAGIYIEGKPFRIPAHQST